jgi:hypothetical protein
VLFLTLCSSISIRYQRKKHHIDHCSYLFTYKIVNQGRDSDPTHTGKGDVQPMPVLETKMITKTIACGGR